MELVTGNHTNAGFADLGIGAGLGTTWNGLGLSSLLLLIFIFFFLEVFQLLIKLNLKILGQALYNQHVLSRVVNLLGQVKLLCRLGLGLLLLLL